jgi:hypothetical protein
MHDCALETREPSCVLKTAKSFFISIAYNPLEPWDVWQHRSSLLGEVEPGAMGHVAAPEPTMAER